MKEWSNLGKIVARRTYARKDNGYIENWEQTAERAIMGNVRGHNVPESEIKQLLYFSKNRKSGPAGRGYWFSGSPAHSKIGGVALNNCWYLNSSNWEHFVIAQDLLMLGGGVGMSVEHKFTSKLPKVKKDVTVIHQGTKDADFIIPDSREGWCELTRRVLEAFFVTGRSFSYSTVCIRGFGEPISGFGGVASGPIPLVKFIQNLCLIFQAREGHHLRPLDAADILTATGEMVVAGNVRRSAIIIMGDCWDKQYLQAKRWSLGNIPTHRSCANYSVVCEDVEDLHPLFWKTYEDGEPFGIVNRKNIRKFGRMGELRKDTAEGVNPCVTLNTWVHTSDGPKQVSDLINKQFIAVIDGEEHSSTKEGFFKTGTKQVFRLNTKEGYQLDLTENHEVLTVEYLSNKKMRVAWKELRTIKPGDLIVLNDHRNYVFKGSGTNNEGWLLGNLLGDGYINDHKAVLSYWGDDKEEMLVGAISTIKSTVGARSDMNGARRKDNSKFEVGSVNLLILANRFGMARNDKTIKPILEKTSHEFHAGFLSGWFDADGSVCGTQDKGISVRLNSSTLANLKAAQRMLSRLGIVSAIYKNRRNTELRLMPDGLGGQKEYLCQANHELVISNANIVEFATTVGFRDERKQRKLLDLLQNYKRLINRERFICKVESIVPIGDLDVFDCTIPSVSAFDANGLYVHNCAEATLENGEPCNLLEQALCNMDDEDEFIRSSRLWFRYGKRVTMERYHHKICDDVIKRNRRVGVGITGCLATALFNPETLNKGYLAIQDEDEKYSAQLGIPRSIRTTVVKPSGTMSKVMDCMGYEGIHAAYSRYFVQRIRFAANDALLPLLRAAGHHTEPVIKLDGSLDHGTWVVDFYVQAPEGMPVADEDWDTWKQLEVLKMAQKYWADQSVSVTVYYRKEDIPKIKVWLAENLDEIKTISFLCHNDHGFLQAPKEAIDEATFERLCSKVKPIDIEQITEGDLESQECAGGVCPIK
jgi:ribonucleotide reductase class II